MDVAAWDSSKLFETILFIHKEIVNNFEYGFVSFNCFYSLVTNTYSTIRSILFYRKPCSARMRAVPIFPLEFVEPWKDIANTGARKPRLGFRAPAFAMSFRGSTNSRVKIGTARSLLLGRLPYAIKFHARNGGRMGGGGELNSFQVRPQLYKKWYPFIYGEYFSRRQSENT